MALMIPAEPPPDGPGARAEGEVFQALRDGLPDDYFVYSRLRYIQEESAGEGEADFVVLHRELGMLVVECKGKGVRCDGSGKWTRVGRSGEREPMRQSPFAQAQRQVKELVAEIEPRLERLFAGRTRLPLVHGHAVAFPFAACDELSLPLDVKRELVFDATDLAHIGRRLQATLAFWSRAAPANIEPLTAKEFKRFRHGILQPTLRIVPNLRAKFAAESRTFLQLSEEQALVVDGWIDNDRYRVHGGAGTGKTVLALETARRLAEQGKRVLLVCFNRYLARHLRQEAESGNVEPGSIDASNFHTLCAHASYLLHERKLDVPEGVEASTTFWNEDAPLVLLEALDSGRMQRWDSIVVDEGQDFAASWWPVLEDALVDAKKGRLLVFYDPSQNIFGRQDAVPEFPSYRLTVNYRNTKHIAEVVRHLGDPKMRPFPRCPEGEPPKLHELQSAAKMKRRLADIVEQLRADGIGPEQLTILTPHSRPKSSLSGLEELAGVPLTSDPTDRDGKLLHTTIGRFKGLESEVVIFVDVDPQDPRCSRRARYVAASRARHMLHVFAKGDWLA